MNKLCVHYVLDAKNRGLVVEKTPLKANFSFLVRAVLKKHPGYRFNPSAYLFNWDSAREYARYFVKFQQDI